MAASTLEFDLRDKATLADPFPIYERLRQEAPVYWHAGLKSWILTRYDDVKHAYLTRDLSSDRITPFYDNLPDQQQNMLRDVVHFLKLWMVFRDPPKHTRIRKLMNAAFTPSAIQDLSPHIERIVDRLLDNLDPSNPIDFVAHFAVPLPALVIMRMLGVPEDMLAKMKEWSDDMVLFIGSAQSAPDKYERARKGSHHMAAYFKSLIDTRRFSSQEDILSAMITAQEKDDCLSDDELIATCMLILFAGHETTTNMISSSILALSKFPDQKRVLIQNPNLTETAIEEFLRFDGPINAIGRVVLKDHEINDIRLTAGDRVFAITMSANRDEEHFSVPNVLNITRKKNRHLTFGHGPHFCLGAFLARLEGKIALTKFLERFPHHSCLSETPLTWIDSLTMRGVKTLPIRVR